MYEDAEKNKILDNYEFESNAGQVASYKDMEVALKDSMQPVVLNTCRSDLESWGFILTTKQMPAYDCANFVLTSLELKYIEFEDTAVNGAL